MAVRIQFRRGDANAWATANPVLAQGELGYESTSKIIKFGDGQSTWSSLPVAAAGDIMSVKAGAGLRYAAQTTDTTQTNIAGAPPGGESGNVVLEIDPTVVLSATVMEAKGDLIVGTADNTYAIVPVGSTGQALVADPATSVGVKWGTVTDPVISDGFITTANLAANSVTTDKVAASAITDAKLASNSVTTAKIAATAVDGTKIADSSITADKIAANAIETAKINNSAVTADKIAASSVTATKVGADVYQRSTTSFTASSAKIFINNNAASNPPTGSPGDIWFRYV